MFDWSTITRTQSHRSLRRSHKPRRDYSAAIAIAGAAIVGGLWLLVIVGLAAIIGATSAISAGVGSLEQGRRREKAGL